MPKSRRNKSISLTQVDKKGREHKDKLFANVREAVGEYQNCFVFSIDNSRNNYLKTVRQELSDSAIFFGKSKLMAKALGLTPEEAQAPGLELLTPHIHGQVGLLFTNRPAADVTSYLSSISEADFARAGTVASRTFVIPAGVVYSTAGEVPAEHDVILEHTLEPELRKLGVPTRMVRGKIVLGEEDGSTEDYVVCKEGQVLDSRQTRLLKMFSAPISQFRIRVIAYWSAATSKVTEVEPLTAGEAASSESD
ncbi:Ribosome assembly factor mrt4 [Ceratocystis lukuohia]|uniref:Ribosome assembly factor mrt4 n=2 Tax=Ceratocystis TaxID=5157 RepID=A0A2C5X5Z7_9PEZI|nr:Ribosome assembly factor mrt4 [Ceratocystis fimbriata CBS 114723]